MVVWSDPADTDREQIIFFISMDNLQAAIALDDLFTNAADSLSDFPRMGKPGRLEGTYELVIHPHYILVYTCHDEEGIVSIDAVLHTSRQWPPE
ncbi:type II toxin-antitoxin system RelE/ParE family toxin [Desulfovibrio sp. OttesenSCG-928-C14]|nr:type II toxin-antitoxin system RelE/ParE family toxin [Desulfovibrio sp. OttesenSCG-928-C14]